MTCCVFLQHAKPVSNIFLQAYSRCTSLLVDYAYTVYLIKISRTINLIDVRNLLLFVRPLVNLNPYNCLVSAHKSYHIATNEKVTSLKCVCRI